MSVYFGGFFSFLCTMKIVLNTPWQSRWYICKKLCTYEHNLYFVRIYLRMEWNIQRLAIYTFVINNFNAEEEEELILLFQLFIWKRKILQKK